MKKREALAALKEEVSKHPIMAGAMIRYLEAVAEEIVEQYDIASEICTIVHYQGQRALVEQLCGILKPGNQLKTKEYL